MKKKSIIIFLLILVALLVTTYFVLNKINKEKRDYQIESILDYKYYVLKSNQKYGVIDETGKVIIDPQYDKLEIPNPSKEVFICYKNEKSIAINSNNQQLFSEYNTIEPIYLKNSATNLPYEKSVLKSEKNGQYGLIDFSGKKILNTEFEEIDGFSNIEGMLQIKKNDKVGIVNIKGTVIVKPDYDVILEDNYYIEGNDDKKNQGFIVGKKSEDGFKYGYVNYNGKLIIKMEFNDISRVTEIPAEDGVYLIAAKNGQYGVIKNKKSIINNEYQSIEYNSTNKIFILEKTKNYGVADITGKTIIPIENTKVTSNGEYIYVEKNNVREVYNVTGTKVDVDYNQYIMATPNNNYKITINSEEFGNFYGVIGANNKQIIKAEYLYIEYAFDNYFIVCGQNGKLGIIDSNGNTVIELKYDLVQKIQGKNMIQTLLSQTNTTEIYSKNMKKICEMENAILENRENYIKIYSDKDIKYFNTEGEESSASKIHTNSTIFATVKDGKWGYVDSNGKIVVNYEYDFASEINENGFAAIKKDGKWGAVDKNGKIVVEPKYETNESYNNVDFIGEYIKDNSGFGVDYYTNDV